MRNFIVLKNGQVLKMVHASGNLKALCEVLAVTGLPDFPMHTHEGLLFAKADNDTYMVFDNTDAHAHDLALAIIKKPQAPVKKKRLVRIPPLFKLPQLPTLTLEEPSYVV